MNTKRIGSVTRRRRILGAFAACMGIAALPVPGWAQGSKPLVEVWKSPSCGCCSEWIKHLEANGFQVKYYDKGNTAVRKEFGMPEKFGSCHTAKVEGYVLEGHVPAREIHRLIKERPKSLGLSVPDMPIGSPGMDGLEYGGQQDPYDVLLVQRNGSATIFASYRDKKGKTK